MTPPPSSSTEEEYSAFLNSVTDEIFFVIQESVGRVKVCYDGNTICAFINFLNMTLESEYFKFVAKCADVRAGHELNVKLVRFFFFWMAKRQALSQNLTKQQDWYEQCRDHWSLHRNPKTATWRLFKKNVC
jgi:hypothetical protein